MEEISIIEKIELDNAVMSLRSDGIIQTEVHDNADIKIADAQQLMGAYLKLSNGGGVPHMIVFMHMSMTDRSVMKFMAEEANEVGKADAIVIDSKAQKILADFYILVQRPKVPTKFFRLEDDAIQWLKQYVD